MRNALLERMCGAIVSAVSAQEQKIMTGVARVTEATRRKRRKPGRKAIYSWPASYSVVERKLLQWKKRRGEKWTEFSMDDISSETKIPKYILQNYFQIYLKKDFRIWKTEMKIDVAKNLLTKYPTMSICKVGVLSGYDDSSNFHRQFRRFAGMTPHQWRDEYGNF